MADAVRSTLSGPGVAGVLQGVMVGTMPQDWAGESMTRLLQVNCVEDASTGYPAGSYSLRMDNWGFWRFRWAVQPGTMTKAVWVMQALNQSPRPSVILKANAAVGLAADAETFAAAGAGWTLITLSFVATASGVIWVELHNNLKSAVYCPCYWSGTDFTAWIQGVPMLDTSLSSTVTPPSTIGGKHRVSAKQERSRSP